MNIFILFFLLAWIYIFPHPSNILTHIPGLGDWSGDTLGVLHEFWKGKSLFTLGIQPGFNPFLGSPFGVETEFGIEKIMPFFNGLVLVLTRFFHEGVAYNLFTLLGISFSAFAMFVLVRNVTGCALGAIFGGVIYGFSPNLICQALAGHLSYTHVEWIPLYILFLWRFLEGPSFLRALLTSLFFSLIWLSDPYLGYFTSFFSLIFLLQRFILFERGKGFVLPKLCGVFGIFFTAALIMLPFTYETISSIFLHVPSVSPLAQQEGLLRSFGDVSKYSARIWDYFIPSELNPFLGSWAQRVVHRLGGRHLSDRTLYLGAVPSLLALYGLVAGWRQRKKCDPEKSFVISAMTFCAVVMMIFSLSPEVGWGGWAFPAPSALLYRFFPMFRYYSRAGFFVSLCVAVLAGFGLSEFLKKRARKKSKILWFIFFSGALACEYTLVPPVRNVDVSTAPLVYQWLERQRGDFIVAEYPLFRSMDERSYQYRSNQRFHGKRLMNGSPEMKPASWLLNSNQNLWEEEVEARLATLGVKYAVVHKEHYRKNVYHRMMNALGLKLVQDFPDASIFEVMAEPKDLIWVTGNTYLPEMGLGEYSWQWFAGSGGFVFYNKSHDHLTCRLKFLLTSFEQRRQVKVRLGDHVLTEVEVEPGKVKEIVLNPLIFEKGLNTVFLDVSPGAGKRSDGRKVSVAVSEIQFDEGSRAEDHSS
ncbi:MAG: hypothetical protein HYS08_01245 [Chlamydiae bacterium]|nr:hypothetical protein [Chlamydiota bacterium]MBI3266867.1 hypothetical protein [Chlamydiota bacterium]